MKKDTNIHFNLRKTAQAAYQSAKCDVSIALIPQAFVKQSNTVHIKLSD